MKPTVQSVLFTPLDLGFTHAGCPGTVPRHLLYAIATLAKIAVVVLILQAIAAQQLYAKSNDRPNIILIMADDVGYECFGCYGSRQYKTPNLDRLAARGIRFNHCYAQPLCTPSRVKLMTGLSNVRNYSAFSILNRGEKTFAHYLKQAGYRTAVAGKWQLLGAEHYRPMFRGKGTRPKAAGFDRYCLWQVEKLGSRYWSPLLDTDGVLKQYSQQTYGPDIACDYLLKFMEENKEGPFLAYYPMILVHNPFRPTPDSANRTSKNRQKNFEDMVAYMDKLVGRIVRKSEALGIARDTFILFMGDNGTNKAIRSQLNGLTIRGGKGKTTDAGTRVPLIAYCPGVIPGGRVSDGLIDFADMLPTLLAAAGLERPAKCDGHSFLPELLGTGKAPDDWMFEFYCPRPEKTAPVRFVRDRRWKLYGDGRFFDVPNDVLEQRPLTGNLSRKAAAAHRKLKAALETFPVNGQSLLKFTP